MKRLTANDSKKITAFFTEKYLDGLPVKKLPEQDRLYELRPLKMAFPNSSTEMPPFDKMIDAFIAMARELAESPEFAPVLQRVGLHDQLKIPELYAIDESIIESAPRFLATAGMYRMYMVPALARRFATKAIDPSDTASVRDYVVPRIRPKPTIDPYGTKVTGPPVKASEILRMLHNLYRTRPEFIEMFEELKRDVVSGVIPIDYLQGLCSIFKLLPELTR